MSNCTASVEQLSCWLASHPHSLRHSYATESLRLGAVLQDFQDALGHADPRTTRRYDRSRHNFDRSPNYLLATVLSGEDIR